MTRKETAWYLSMKADKRYGDHQRSCKAKKVPPYMMPDQVVRVRQMPQNANGKKSTE